MRIIRGLRQVAIVLCLAAAPLAAPAAAVPAYLPASDPVYAVELRAFLESTHLYERSMKALPTPADLSQRETILAFRVSMTADQYYAKALPVFARYIPPRHAATLGAMARKRPVPLGTQQEAMQSFWEMEKKALPEMTQVWRDLFADFDRRMLERAVGEIRRSVNDLAEHRGTGYEVKLNKVGLSYLDRMVWLVVNNVLQNMNATRAMENDCKAGGDVLLPANILAENGIATARKAIDTCERALETMEKTTEAAFTQTKEGLMALELPGKAGFIKGLDRGARGYYDFTLKHGEMNRQALEVQRRAVSLVEARRATIHLKDERMLFEEQSDLDEYNRMVNEMGALEKSINDLIYQQRQKTPLRNIDFRDGITAPQDVTSSN
jgi:hypothetical protein